jgi:flavin reductase (DIM6/NTAB) family NADH-FMN oxidoreductase RutF
MKKTPLQIKAPDHVKRYLWKQCTTVRQVYLISTIDKESHANIAPKTWATPCGDDPPVFMFCCTSDHRTGRNVLSTREFVVNYPGIELVEKVAAAGGSHDTNKIEAVGLTPIPSEKVKPPRIAECFLHLECVLEEKIKKGDSGYIFFGRVVAASSDVFPEDKGKKLTLVDPLVYISGKYGSVCNISDWKWPIAP